MTQKKKVYIFDFDGTLTNCDTLIEFIRFSFSPWACAVGLLLVSPLVVLMKLGLYSNSKAKQRLFSHFFKGMSLEMFNNNGEAFAECNERYMRQKAVDFIMDKAKETPRPRLIIVSASFENWVEPFARLWLGNGKGNDITVLGTRPEVNDGLLTGRFATPNCYGAEKVRRVSEVLGDRSDYFIEAFGDSRGDKELFDYADKAHFRPFE